MIEVFGDWRDLPSEVQKHLDILEDFIGDLDGKTMGTATNENTFLDEGTVDASDATKAVNAVVAFIRKCRPPASKMTIEQISAELIELEQKWDCLDHEWITERMIELDRELKRQLGKLGG